jgi:hypothetical protein
MRVRRAAGLRMSWTAALCLAGPLGCGGDDMVDGLTCVENLAKQCTPAFPGTWDNVYEFVIQQRCGGGAGTACHGRDGMQGGLGLFSQNAAYAALVDGEGGEPRVVPGDAGCSVLMERVVTSDLALRMPLRAAPLSAAEQCAIQQWISAGALP